MPSYLNPRLTEIGKSGVCGMVDNSVSRWWLCPPSSPHLRPMIGTFSINKFLLWNTDHPATEFNIQLILPHYETSCVGRTLNNLTEFVRRRFGWYAKFTDQSRNNSTNQANGRASLFSNPSSRNADSSASEGVKKVLVPSIVIVKVRRKWT